MNLQPIKNNVVLYLDEKSQMETPSGLILPNERKPEQGKIVATGDECTYVKNDDVAFFGKFKGEEMEIDGKKYLIIKESELLAVYRQFRIDHLTKSVPIGGRFSFLNQFEKMC